MGTESDPVIIAQRLLNLYRQLHIFSSDKKDAYDRMLLEQPAEIKKILGTLPGGIVVQQYIADLEAEKGLAVENFENDLPPKPEPVAAPVFTADPQGTQRAAPVQPTVVSVANDPAMIKGIVDAFKEAIITSEKNRKEDTKELAQTIVALQSKLMQSMMAKMPTTPAQNPTVEAKSATVETTKVTTVETRVTSSNEASGGIQASQLEDIVAGISRAQSQLIKEMAATQTEQLSQLISKVLKEIQQMSTQTLIDAVQAVHRENMDFFKNQIFSSVSMVTINKEMADDEDDEDYFYERKKAKKSHKRITLRTEEKNAEDYEWQYVSEPIEQETYQDEEDKDNADEWEYVEEPVRE